MCRGCFAQGKNASPTNLFTGENESRFSQRATSREGPLRLSDLAAQNHNRWQAALSAMKKTQFPAPTADTSLPATYSRMSIEAADRIEARQKDREEKRIRNTMAC